MGEQNRGTHPSAFDMNAVGFKEPEREITDFIQKITPYRNINCAAVTGQDRVHLSRRRKRCAKIVISLAGAGKSQKSQDKGNSVVCPKIHTWKTSRLNVCKPGGSGLVQRCRMSTYRNDCGNHRSLAGCIFRPSYDCNLAYVRSGKRVCRAGDDIASRTHAYIEQRYAICHRAMIQDVDDQSQTFAAAATAAASGSNNADRPVQFVVAAVWRAVELQPEARRCFTGNYPRREI